ncbi:MAG: molybdopterin molybdotransferase MoeA [Micromonosporaceae bacterium]
MTLTAPDWDAARTAAHQAGVSAQPAPTTTTLADADGATLAEPLVTLTELPAFPTSSVDGFAVRGDGPWRVVGQVLAGGRPEPLDPGHAVEIATGTMVPDGTEQIIRVEHSEAPRPGYVTGEPRPHPDWRDTGEEAGKGEELLPAGTPVTPGVIGLAASCGYDSLTVHKAPTAALLIFGDELATHGPPGDGRVRDSLGPSMPAWLRRLGAAPQKPRGPIQDTLDAHVAALREALATADIVCTTGGTMHGPVDHLHPALEAVGAAYVVNTVKVRPGFPMLLARTEVDGKPRFVAGLPGNPQSAVVALVSLVAPLIAGLTGRDLPALGSVTLGEPVKGRGGDTHLSLVRVGADGLAYPLKHSGSAMLRGVAQADGFAVIRPTMPGAGTPAASPPPGAEAGDTAELVPLPLMRGERP